MKSLQIFSAVALVARLCCSQPVAPDGPDAHEDWSVNIVESTMERFSPQTIGGWDYFVSLYLMGQYAVYKRTGDNRYMDYIHEWADRWFDEQGIFTRTTGSLDSVQAGNILLIVYKETGDEKYAAGARKIREAMKTYPRTSDGAFWHAKSLTGQIWADGSFMVNPFLIRWAHLFNETDLLDDETTKQIILYGDHLQMENGLLQHAFDESRASSWADPETGLSEEQWCRAMGWYGLAITDILELLPVDHHNRPEILDKLHKFLAGVKRYQDRETGRWYQVVNKGDLDENWTETSCSAMFTYTTDISLAKGWLRDYRGQYKKLVAKGHAGVLEQVVKNADGLTDVVEIVIGTGVGDLQYYFDRPRKTNDKHGLGAVLLMNEQVLHNNHIVIGC